MSIHKKAMRANFGRKNSRAAADDVDDCQPQSWTPLSSSLPTEPVLTPSSPFGASCRDTVRCVKDGRGGLGAAALAASSHALFAAGMSLEDVRQQEVQPA